MDFSGFIMFDIHLALWICRFTSLAVFGGFATLILFQPVLLHFFSRTTMVNVKYFVIFPHFMGLFFLQYVFSKLYRLNNLHCSIF